MSDRDHGFDVDEYQRLAKSTAIYPRVQIVIDGGEPIDAPWLYPLLGMVGETGEIAEKFKKVIRDKRGVIADDDRAGILKELGDPHWYQADLAGAMGWRLSEVLRVNLQKLFQRKSRGTLSGSGDDR